MLASRGTDLRGDVFDTMVASYMVNPALRAQTLEDVVSTRYGGVLPDRALTPETGAEEGTQARRAAAEALTALLVRPALETELTEGGLMSLFREVEMPLVPVLARMELAGVALDLEALAAMREEFGATLAGLESRIYELVGHPFNIGSPKQLEQILFTELGLPATKRTRTGFSTDASVLDELREQHEVIGLILEHRQVSKLKSTYVDALPTLVGADARLHTNYQQAVAATGRLSSTDPNLQNIPIRTALGRRIRRAFVAPAGPAAAGGRLLAAGAAHPRPRVWRRRASRRLRRALGHPPRRRRPRAGPGAGERGAEGAQRGEDDQLRDRVRALRLRPRGAAEDPARGGAEVHRRLLRRVRGHPPLHRRDEDPGARPGVRDDAARSPPVPAGALRPQHVAALGRASGWRSTCRSRAPPPTG